MDLEGCDTAAMKDSNFLRDYQPATDPNQQL